MLHTATILARYGDALPAWVTRERVEHLLSVAPEEFEWDMQAAVAQEDALGRRGAVEEILLGYLAGVEFAKARRDPDDTEGLPRMSLEDYAATL